MAGTLGDNRRFYLTGWLARYLHKYSARPFLSTGGNDLHLPIGVYLISWVIIRDYDTITIIQTINHMKMMIKHSNLAEILAQVLFVLSLIALVASQGVSAQTTCSSADIDQDDDGLIEICDLEGLDAIRHQPDGTGYKASADATRVTTGCRSGGCDRL